MALRAAGDPFTGLNACVNILKSVQVAMIILGKTLHIYFLSLDGFLCQ